MIYPGTLIRWGALGTLALLVRAIVRENRDERGSIVLLPPEKPTPAKRRTRRTRTRSS